MADELVVKVSGLNQLKNNLVQLPIETQGKPLFDALFAAAAPIVKEAQSLAPKDTGNMASKIHAAKKTTKEHDAEVDVKVSGGAKKKGGDRNPYYWKFIEFGHRTRPAHGRRTRKEQKQQGGEMVPARPFIRPAFESQKLNALEQFRRALAASIENIRARLVGS